MLELVASVCRGMACDARLLILYRLVEAQELASAEVAARTRLARNVASLHLGQLVSLGFLGRRRSGRRVYYRLAGGGERAAPVGLLRRALGGPHWATQGWSERRLLHIGKATARKVDSRVAVALDVVFDAATAFTTVRRVQVLRRLTEQGPCREDVARALGMSPQAWRRHIDKLVRRGYVACRGGEARVLDGSSRSRFHAALLSHGCGFAGWSSHSS